MQTPGIWWPSPDALNDLIVKDTEEGFTLSAPDGTECALWIGYFNQTEELREQFTTALTESLMIYLNQLKDKDGRPFQNSFGNEDSYPSQAEEDTAGPVN